jgi:hypothetical protein
MLALGRHGKMEKLKLENDNFPEKSMVWSSQFHHHGMLSIGENSSGYIIKEQVQCFQKIESHLTEATNN